MVWTSASTSTVRPCSRAVAAVIGPMQATTGGTVSQTARKFRTVDDDVNVTTSAAAAAARSAALGRPCTVR